MFVIQGSDNLVLLTLWVVEILIKLLLWVQTSLLTHHLALSCLIDVVVEHIGLSVLDMSLILHLVHLLHLRCLLHLRHLLNVLLLLHHLQLLCILVVSHILFVATTCHTDDDNNNYGNNSYSRPYYCC